MATNKDIGIAYELSETTQVKNDSQPKEQTPRLSGNEEVVRQKRLPSGATPSSPDEDHQRERKMIDTSVIDPQAYDGKVPDELNEIIEKNKGDMEKIYRRIKNINILITGLTGSGKSALANALLGREDGAIEGSDLSKGCTVRVEGRTSDIMPAIGIRVWDTPGLKDGTKAERKYLREILKVWERYKSNDLVIFCIEAKQRCVLGKDNQNVQAMIDLTKKFGPKFWKNAVVVLTFANNIETFNLDWRRKSREEKGDCFKKKIEEYTKLIKINMKEHVKIDRDIVDKIKVIPAGHHTIPELPDRNYWFTTLWFVCLDTIPTEEGKETFLFHNQDRVSLRVKDDISRGTTAIVLTDHFIPEELIDLQRKYKIRGGLIGLIGLLGGPLALLTIVLGMRRGIKYGETRYADQLKLKPTQEKTRGSANPGFSIN